MSTPRTIPDALARALIRVCRRGIVLVAFVFVCQATPWLWNGFPPAPAHVFHYQVVNISPGTPTP